jgi:hypothetical protein
MSERNFSRRRRNTLRFRPNGGLSNSQRERQAGENRAETLQAKTLEEPIFDRHRHEDEIIRAENRAAGLPPELETLKPLVPPPPMPKPQPEPFQAVDTKYCPVPVAEPPPQGLVDSIRVAANKVIEKVQRLIKPNKRIHKEVIVNSECLETRVAVLEEGKLEEFTIERTTEERLVGSIYKGKVRNLEDGLKAAFVDIGFEKNAFLHYWDIVPSSFDSSVEIVERDTKKRDKPRITQVVSTGQRYHNPGDQRTHRHQGPPGNHQPFHSRTVPGAAAEFGPMRYFPQDREIGGTPTPEENLAPAHDPRRNGGDHPHRG